MRPSLPARPSFDSIDDSVAFEWEDDAESDLRHAIVVEYLAGQGEVTVDTVDGVKRHELRRGMRRGYVVQMVESESAPDKLRVWTTSFSPLALGIERAAWWAGLGLSAAFVAYVVLVVMDGPGGVGPLLLFTPLAALVIFVSMLVLGRMLRIFVDAVMRRRGEADEAVSLARELRSELRKRAPRSRR